MTRNSHALNLELFTLPSKLENKSLDEKLLIALPLLTIKKIKNLVALEKSSR
jgi:hypothetical protein